VPHWGLARNVDRVFWRALTVTVAAGLGTIALVAALSGCTGKSSSASAPSTTQITEIQTITRAPSTPASSAPYVPAPATTVAPLGQAKAPMPAGSVEGTCPYISNTDLANAEGDHVYRTATLTTLTPVGCRFYFYSAPYEAIADILPMTFPTATEAYNARGATGAAGTGTLGVKDLIPGVDGVLYKTAFLGPDAAKGGDWACAFAKGKVMVVVHTEQTNVSFNARQIATLIAAKF
jgi:hypothetical protein